MFSFARQPVHWNCGKNFLSPCSPCWVSLSLWPQAPFWSLLGPCRHFWADPWTCLVSCHTALSLFVCRRGGPRAPGSRLRVSLHPSPCCTLLLQAWTAARRAPSPGFVSRTPINEEGFPSWGSAARIESDFVLKPEVGFLTQADQPCNMLLKHLFWVGSLYWAAGTRSMFYLQCLCSVTRTPVPVCLSRCSFFRVFVPLEECLENMNRHQVYFWIRRLSSFQKLGAHKLSHVSPAPWACRIQESKRSPPLLTSKPGWFSG